VRNGLLLQGAGSPVSKRCWRANCEFFFVILFTFSNYDFFNFNIIVLILYNMEQILYNLQQLNFVATERPKRGRNASPDRRAGILQTWGPVQG
jgi:hypothetical protein